MGKIPFRGRTHMESTLRQLALQPEVQGVIEIIQDTFVSKVPIILLINSYQRAIDTKTSLWSNNALVITPSRSLQAAMA